jgi:hypothetical protein
MTQALPMKSAPTRKLFAYWNARRGTRLAPERGDIEPGAIRDILGDSFIIAFDAAAEHPFRLAGTRVCTLFGRELKGEPFVRMWDEASREDIARFTATVADDAVALVAGASARTAQGSPADLELLLLPLYHRGRTHVRLLGTLAPVTPPYWLGAEHVGPLSLGAVRHLGPVVERMSAPQFATAEAGRQRHGLTVYDGGRS